MTWQSVVATSTVDRGFVGFVMMVLCVVVVADWPYSFICCFVYFPFFFLSVPF
jgi:hypothetical protein